jgi:hypothetical protein
MRLVFGSKTHTRKSNAIENPIPYFRGPGLPFQTGHG